jgi:hypothetical protein
MRKTSMAFALCLLFLIVLAGCSLNQGDSGGSGSSGSPLVGTWSASITTYVFNSDGTWSETVGSPLTTLSGTYTSTSTTVALTYTVGGSGTTTILYSAYHGEQRKKARARDRGRAAVTDLPQLLFSD